MWKRKRKPEPNADSGANADGADTGSTPLPPNAGDEWEAPEIPEQEAAKQADAEQEASGEPTAPPDSEPDSSEPEPAGPEPAEADSSEPDTSGPDASGPDASEPGASGPAPAPAAAPTTAAPRRLVTAARIRVVVLIIAIGALVGVVATFAIRGADDAPDELAGLTPIPAPTTSAAAGEAFGTAAAGDCLTWSELDASDLEKVDCADEHLFEVAAEIDLSLYPGSDFGPDAEFPAELRFAELRSEICGPAVQNYLGTQYDPYGKFSVNLINPGEVGWSEGERTVRCGLQSVGTAGQVYPVTGRVAEQDQARILEPETCVGITMDIPSDPVSCDEAHAYEVYAVVDLRDEFLGAMPSVEDQDRFLDERCTALAHEYLGDAERLEATTLTPFWENVRLASWTAGSTRVNCALAAPLETGGFSTLTGSARGELLIDGEPPAPDEEEPR